MQDAQWKSEDRAQSYLTEGAGILMTSEDEEESSSTVVFCVSQQFPSNWNHNHREVSSMFGNQITHLTSSKSKRAL